MGPGVQPAGGRIARLNGGERLGVKWLWGGTGLDGLKKVVMGSGGGVSAVGRRERGRERWGAGQQEPGGERGSALLFHGCGSRKPSGGHNLQESGRE